MASWEDCVLVLDSSKEPAAHPGEEFACVSFCFRSEFDAKHATSDDQVPSPVQKPPMCFASSL